MNMNRDGRVFKLDVCKTFDDLYEMSNSDDDDSPFGLDVCKSFDDLYEKANASDDGTFDVSSRFDNLYETANENDDVFDIIAQKMENLLYLGIEKQDPITDYYNINYSEENKENVAPDQFINYHNSANVYNLCGSTKKLRTTKLHNTHSIAIGEIKMVSPRTKNSMITGLRGMKNITSINSHIRPVVKHQYKYEHVKSGSKVLRSRNTSSSEFEQNTHSNNTDDTIKNKQIKNENDCKQIKKYQNLNTSIQSNGTYDGIMKNKELGHDRIKVVEKKHHIITKHFSFESRKSSAVKSQKMNEENTKEHQWTFKVRPATVLKVKSLNGCKQMKKYQNLNTSIQSNGIKMHGRSQKIKVFNTYDGIMKNKELGHDGIKVIEKKHFTITKPFSFESRKSSVKPQILNVENTKVQQWTFKARPATVLKIKPFIPKHEKICTEPRNIYLNTERRAQEWIVFKEKNLKKNLTI